MLGIFTDHLDTSHEKQLPGSVREEFLIYQAVGLSLPQDHPSFGVMVTAAQEVNGAQTGKSHTHNANPIKPGRFCPWRKVMQHISEDLSLPSVQGKPVALPLTAQMKRLQTHCRCWHPQARVREGSHRWLKTNPI